MVLMYYIISRGLMYRLRRLTLSLSALSLGAAQVDIVNTVIFDVGQIFTDYNEPDQQKIARLEALITPEFYAALFKKPDNLFKFSDTGDKIRKFAQQAELRRNADGNPDIPYILAFARTSLPSCSSIKEFKEVAKNIADRRGLDTEAVHSLEDRLLLSLSTLEKAVLLLQLFVLNSYDSLWLNESFKKLIVTLDKKLFKEQLEYTLDALMPCQKFIVDIAKERKYPQFDAAINALGEYALFVQDAALRQKLEGFLAGMPILLHAIAKRSDLDRLAIATEKTYSTYDNPLILELIRFNINFPDKRVPRWQEQRDLIKEELKKFTYDSFPWFYKRVWDDGKFADYTNILSWLIQHNDTDLLYSLPLLPGAPILSEPVEQRRSSSAELLWATQSLYSKAFLSPEWVKKLRALGSQADIAQAGAAAVPVLLEDLALGLALLKY